MSLELRVPGYGLEVRSYELRCHFELSPRAVTPSCHPERSREIFVGVMSQESRLRRERTIENRLGLMGNRQWAVDANFTN
jgi:hypothetical protein